MLLYTSLLPRLHAFRVCIALTCFTLPLVTPELASCQDFFDEIDAIDPQDDAPDDAVANPFGELGAMVDPLADSPDDAGTGDASGVNATAELPEGVPVSEVVQAIRDREATTAIQWMRSLDQLVRLGQPDEARNYLQQLMSQSLSDPQLAALHQHFGTAPFLRLARASELAPEGREFALKTLKAATRVRDNPDNLRQWVADLGAEERRTQLEAARQLLLAGDRAVPALVAGIASATPADTELRDHAMTIIGKLDRAAVGPLRAILDHDDPAQTATAVRALGHVGDRSELPILVGPLLAPRTGTAEQEAAVEAWRQIWGQLPAREEAVELLARAADRAYRGLTSDAADVDGNVRVWMWDPATKLVAPEPLRLDDVANLRAARLYDDLQRVAPDMPQARMRRVISSLAVAQAQVGLDVPLAVDEHLMLFRELASDQISASDALHQAIKDENELAAIALARWLQTQGELRDLTRFDEQSSALVEALTHPNSRLRFAAAKALATLAPSGSFDGAGRVLDGLAYTATSRGKSRVIVAHPNPILGQDLRGLLLGSGFSAELVSTARDLLARAAASADIEFVMLSDSLNHASTWDTVEALRANPKTARIPIVLLARRNNFERNQRIADLHAGVFVTTERLIADDLSTLLPRLQNAFPRDTIDPAERLSRASDALATLGDLLARFPEPIRDNNDLLAELVAATGTTELIQPAVEALAAVATPAAQQALLDVASQNGRPLDDRKAATAAFRESLSQHGLRLAESSIQQQYDRYNASRTLDAETQQLLSGILDAIEQAETSTPSS